MSIAAKRSKLCSVIVSLSQQAPYSEVCRLMDPLLYGALDDHDGCTTDDRPTLLMLACAKSNTSCLQYIATKLKEDPLYITLFGDPFAKSASTLGENSAIHYAAMSGFSEAIPLLKDIAITLQRNEASKVVTATNKNGDTCAMMACVDGHLPFLKRLWHLEGTDLSIYFTLKNQCGNSALTLASGHGHPDIVEFLLSATDGPEIKVQYSDIEACKQKLTSIDKALSMVPDSHCSWYTKRNNVKRCLVYMQVLSARAAQSAMEELITQEHATPTSVTKMVKATKAQKTKNVVATPIADKVSMDDGQATKKRVWKKPPSVEDPLDKSIYVPRYRTLPSGAVVKPGPGHVLNLECDEVEHGLPLIEVNTVAKSADDMLRERYRDPLVRQSRDDAIDSVMDSLCLKASMLLYTSHGMALDLSPSQLEAIEEILSNQLVAVKEAKEIQARTQLQKS